MRTSTKSFGILIFLLLLFAGTAGPAVSAEDPMAGLEPVVVTATTMDPAGTLEVDPKKAQSPLTPSDGGSFLKSLSGFTTSRKGGTSGDPMFRGQGGSRLNLVTDGGKILGGCPNRMDPPTAYIYPQSYDRVEIIKGPQSVEYGSAHTGEIRFERETDRFDEPGTRGYTSMTAGQFGRTDLMTDVTVGNESGYTRLIGTISTRDDYADGDGNELHSQYQRWSGTGIFGLTPDDRTEIELTLNRSDGETAFDDRGMDGTRYDRTGADLSFTRRDLSPLVSEVNANVYHNAIDHWMDSFRLREEAPTGGEPTMNPDRKTTGGRASAELTPTSNLVMTVGADYLDDQHRKRMYLTDPRKDNAEFQEYGVFAELEQELSPRDFLTYGVRVDRNEATALMETMMTKMKYGGVDAGTSDDNTLTSGFVRYNRDFAGRPLTLYTGVGRSERAPDFWERDNRFDVEPETLHQVDAGMNWETEDLEANLSAFYGQYDDYLLINWDPKNTLNVDATHYGLEADATLRLNRYWQTKATASYVRGENDSQDEPLAQTSAPEGSVSLDYDDGRYFTGGIVRLVDEQDRIHPDHGSIFSYDPEKPTPGFATASIYSGVRLSDRMTFSVGVDNLFDKTYHEHIQKRGDGYTTPADEPMNEPGRMAWFRAETSF
jgi:iron complex outermembrane receptor protein